MFSQSKKGKRKIANTSFYFKWNIQSKHTVLHDDAKLVYIESNPTNGIKNGNERMHFIIYLTTQACKNSLMNIMHISEMECFC